MGSRIHGLLGRASSKLPGLVNAIFDARRNLMTIDSLIPLDEDGVELVPSTRTKVLLAPLPDLPGVPPVMTQIVHVASATEAKQELSQTIFEELALPPSAFVTYAWALIEITTSGDAFRVNDVEWVLASYIDEQSAPHAIADGSEESDYSQYYSLRTTKDNASARYIAPVGLLRPMRATASGIGASPLAHNEDADLDYVHRGLPIQADFDSLIEYMLDQQVDVATVLTTVAVKRYNRNVKLRSVLGSAPGAGLTIRVTLMTEAALLAAARYIAGPAHVEAHELTRETT